MFLDELPSNADYDRILDENPELMIKFSEQTFSRYFHDVWDYRDFDDIRDWLRVLEKRIYHIRFGFVNMQHLFKLGIPDDVYFSANSNTLFPNFTREHHLRKMMFDYFSESVISNLFSAFETIGHIIFQYYYLEFDKKTESRMKISFDSAIRKLKTHNWKLYRSLYLIQKSLQYKRFKTLRNNATHNFPDSSVVPSVSYHPGGLVIHGVGRYTPCTEISEIILDAIVCLNTVIQVFDSYKFCSIQEDKP